MNGGGFATSFPTFFAQKRVQSFKNARTNFLFSEEMEEKQGKKGEKALMWLQLSLKCHSGHLYLNVVLENVRLGFYAALEHTACIRNGLL